ncbi:mRNA methyltransferase, putative [Plasmodium chabaudi adami]|uniref:mRNA methyltransferase, putative n=1 Tax=Plasmodium chabaudi adami TaxID=5826 RepID=A0A1D3S4R3_PLACE|nr:mRNA methyltransferase, putative [Plasmodium chabaudi adami]
MNNNQMNPNNNKNMGAQNFNQSFPNNTVNNKQPNNASYQYQNINYAKTNNPTMMNYNNNPNFVNPNYCNYNNIVPPPSSSPPNNMPINNKHIYYIPPSPSNIPSPPNIPNAPSPPSIPGSPNMDYGNNTNLKNPISEGMNIENDNMLGQEYGKTSHYNANYMGNNNNMFGSHANNKFPEQVPPPSVPPPNMGDIYQYTGTSNVHNMHVPNGPNNPNASNISGTFSMQKNVPMMGYHGEYPNNRININPDQTMIPNNSNNFIRDMKTYDYSFNDNIAPPPLPTPMPPDNKNLESGNSSRNSSNTNLKKNEYKNNSCNINVDGRERLQNDYNQHFINTGERPQNFIRDSDENKRFIKYPKLKQLLELKNAIIKKRSTPARYIKCDLRNFDLSSLDMKFDIILIDPPWKEYYDRKMQNLDLLNSIHIDNYDINDDIYNDKDKYWSLEDLSDLKIDQIAEVPSFLFIWCGVTHLEDARVLLNKWGYRRCEDICWLKTNINEKNKKIKYLNEINNENSYLQRTTEHCLMGIKGAVRRSYDTHLIHANLDTDVIIAEETEENIYNNNKPEELYKIIEKFCLGRRKIELFGTNTNIRNGWLTLGKNMNATLFEQEEYKSWFEGDIAWPEATSYIGGKYMGTTPEIENLRPKSPPRNANP